MENRRNPRINRSDAGRNDRTTNDRSENRRDPAGDRWNPNEHDRRDEYYRQEGTNQDDNRPRDFTRDEREGDDRNESPVGRSGNRRSDNDDRPEPRRFNNERTPRGGDERSRQERGERTQRGAAPRDNDRKGGYDKSRPQFRPEPDEMVYGIQSVIETLRSGQQIDKLYMEKDLSNADIQTLAFQNRVTIQRVPVEKLDRLTRKNHQGVVCLVAAVPYVKLSNVMADIHERGDVPFILLLDRITDVRNFGAIARTAECAGVQCIVIPGKGAAAINSDAMKTSSGALNHVSVCREFNLVDTVGFLQKSGVQVLACTEKSPRDLYTLTTDMRGPVAIVMGSEDDGISPEILRAVDGHVKIPLMGNVGSLNVSVATGVVLYEVVRQRSMNVNVQ